MRFQNLAYGYDAVGNILSLSNDVAIPPPSGMGGPSRQSFAYDDLYRLGARQGSCRLIHAANGCLSV